MNSPPNAKRASRLAAWSCLFQSARTGLIIGLGIGAAWVLVIAPGLKAYLGFSDHDLDQLSPVFLAVTVAVCLWVSIRRWQHSTCALPRVTDPGGNEPRK